MFGLGRTTSGRHGGARREGGARNRGVIRARARVCVRAVQERRQRDPGCAAKQMLEELCNEINAVANEGDDAKTRSGRAVAIELDVSASESVIDAAVKKAWAAFGYFNVLVNNAGMRGNSYGVAFLATATSLFTLNSKSLGFRIC